MEDRFGSWNHIGRFGWICESHARYVQGTSALRACQRVRFEVTEDATATDEGQRYAYTPELGVFHAMTGPHGDIQVSEHRLRTAMTTAAQGGISLQDALSELLGEPWDAELEVFRYAGEDAPVRWLHRVG